MTHPRAWTEQDEAYVLANHERLTAREIGKHLGRSEASVEMRRKRLGLTKPPRRPRVVETTEALACDPTPMEIEQRINAIRAANRMEWVPWSGADEARREKLRAELYELMNPKAEQLELWENVA